eukprot:2034590-Pleurochrysis_carterae.AAC.1
MGFKFSYFSALHNRARFFAVFRCCDESKSLAYGDLLFSIAAMQHLAAISRGYSVVECTQVMAHAVASSQHFKRQAPQTTRMATPLVHMYYDVYIYIPRYASFVIDAFKVRMAAQRQQHRIRQKRASGDLNESRGKKTRTENDWNRRERPEKP